MKSRTFRHIKTLMLAASAMSISACATGGVPKVSEARPAYSPTIEQAVGQDFSAARPAVRRVRLSGDFFALKPAGGEIPASIRDAQVRIDFGGQQPTFDDLMMLLEDRGLSVIMGWDDGSYGENSQTISQVGRSEQTTEQQRENRDVRQADPNQPDAERVRQADVVETKSVTSASGGYGDLRDRRLPFRRYEGTLGGLFRQVQRSMGVTIWWNEGIYVSPVGRYSVMLPQNSDLMNQVVSELKAKGARNVVASLQAGTVSFVAPGALAEEAIRPYLLRLGRNASEVTMQVALVSVVMNEASSKGFDWGAFSFAFGGSASSTTSTTNPSDPFNNGSTGSTTTPRDALFKFNKDSISLFEPAVKLLGVRRPLDIAGAIKFLSQWGNTSVDQNVELRTLAGTDVKWRSGETIPYVSGVSATTTGGSFPGGVGGAIGAAQTEKLETGLTLNLAPNYEANGGLVTVQFNLELRELIEFVTLSAGNQLGSFTQPRTREQKLNDIVRIPVGETVVLGGLRRQLSSTDRNGPFRAYAIGSKGRRDETQTVFIVLRPVVTVYEVAGLDQPLPQKSNEVMVGSNGEPWAQPVEEYRGTNMFGAPVNSTGPARRRPMAQPERSAND